MHHYANLRRRILLVILSCFWVFLFLSAVSFHSVDWPSPAVYPYGPIENLCGPPGAFVAYYSYYALGPGLFPMLFFAGFCLTACIAGKRVSDVWLRTVGILVLSVALASAIHLVHPGSSASLPEGHGGILGIGTSAFLRSHCSGFLTGLILLCTLIVGLLLAADDIVVHTPAFLGGTLNGVKTYVPGLKFKWPDFAAIPAAIPVIGRFLRKRPYPLTPPLQPVRAIGPVAENAVTEIADPPEQDPLPALPPGKADIVVRLPNMLKPRQTSPPPRTQELGEYHLPSWDVLDDAEYDFAESQESFVREKAAVLEQALKEFNIEASVVEIDTGPVITMYEISLAPGIKVSQITALSNDIMRALRAENVRIVAPVPGKNTVGIEVPNAQKERVRFKELMQLAPDTTAKMTIPLFLGKDASGEPLVSDLTQMPHCLIAGTTGSGKSVCINAIIMSVLYKQRPDLVKLILIDPKVVEMAPFKDVPHLMCPVINETGRAVSVLEWACEKMDERYEILAEAGVRNIKGYNTLSREELLERTQPATPEEEAKIPKFLPYIVVIVDELADLMMTSGKEVEGFIVRLAQKSRAVGIHLILCTQRPQATVVTGLIKSNMPARIAFRVSSKMDSRIVLDQNGADLLLGGGDMLFLPPGASKPIRAQGTFIDDREMKDSVRVVRSLAEAQYEPELVQIRSSLAPGEEMEKDELFDDAVRIVLETKRGSVSLLQRRLTIGYSRASRLIEMMAQTGIVGAYKGSQAREAMFTVEEWEAAKAQQQADAASGMTV